MKRGLLLPLAVALCVLAQSNRDGYRTAYRVWRDADPNLERDAAAGGASLGPRTEKSAALTANYIDARAAFLRQLADQNATGLAELEKPEPIPPTPPPDALERLVTNETAAVNHYIDLFSKDSDPGIAQLRQALQQERLALVGLGAAIADRKKARALGMEAEISMGAIRQKVVSEHNQLVASLKQTAEQATSEGAAWAEYYRKLGEGTREVTVAEPKPAIVNPAVVNPAVVNPAVVNPAPADPAPVITNPAPTAFTKAITPLPLIRYTGAWTYPATGGLYHGPQPVFVDLAVREEGGKAVGTMFVRFKVSGDPELRFDFSGEFKNTRSQVFSLMTAEGAKGTIELIPGPAFNLLEVNFQTEPKPGKVQQANMILVKK